MPRNKTRKSTNHLEEVIEDKGSIRKKISSDIKDFLDRGGTIEKVSDAASGIALDSEEGRRNSFLKRLPKKKSES